MHFIYHNEFLAIIENDVDNGWNIHFGHSFFIELHFFLIVQIVNLHCKLVESLSSNCSHLHSHIKGLVGQLIDEKKRLRILCNNFIELRYICLKIWGFNNNLIRQLFHLNRFNLIVNVRFDFLDVHLKVDKASRRV